PSMLDAIGAIDPEHLDRRTREGSLADERRSFPFEMVVPPVGARVEEPDEIVADGVVSCRVAAFGPIALSAAPASVLKRRRSAVLPRTDVVNFVRQDCARLGQMAIFAAVARPFPDSGSERSGHESA